MTPGKSLPYVATVNVPGVTSWNGNAVGDELLLLLLLLVEDDVLPHAAASTASNAMGRSLTIGR